MERHKNEFDAITAADLMNTKFPPLPGWELWMIFEVEPKLKTIGEEALQRFEGAPDQREQAYYWAKDDFSLLVGWEARDPRLRSSGAYDCYTGWILNGEK